MSMEPLNASHISAEDVVILEEQEQYHSKLRPQSPQCPSGPPPVEMQAQGLEKLHSELNSNSSEPEVAPSVSPFHSVTVRSVLGGAFDGEANPVTAPAAAHFPGVLDTSTTVSTGTATSREKQLSSAADDEARHPVCSQAQKPPSM